MKKKTYLLMALTMVSMGMNAQNSGKSSVEKGIENFAKTMTIGGTIRSKYEYQTEEGEGRFEVRTARINVTGNVTLSLAKPFISDIRINYEKYFYRKGGIAKTSEKDKIVVEFMTKF